jgi:hypothetical protein
MRLTCCYSGVSFSATGFNQKKLDLPRGDLTNDLVRGKIGHPIMEASPRFLLETMKEDWDNGELNELERRLLFIALLKTTDHFIFRVPAIPTKNTILKNMELLIRTATWKYAAGDRIRVPKYIVTRDSYRLENIGDVLRSWGEERKYWEERNEFDKLRDRMYLREEALKRALLNERSVEGKIKNITKISDWVMSVIRAPMEKKQLWTAFFNLQEKEDEKKIWKLKKEDLLELLQCMRENLEAGQWLANIAFKHVRELLRINSGGLEFSLGMNGEAEVGSYYENFSEDDLLSFEVDEDGNSSISTTEKHLRYRETPFKILPSDGRVAEGSKRDGAVFNKVTGKVDYIRAPISEEEQIRKDAAANRRIVVMRAPLVEPKKADFPGEVEFLRSWSAWRMADRDRKASLSEKKEVGESKKELDKPKEVEDTTDLAAEEEEETVNVVSLLATSRKGVLKDE